MQVQEESVRDFMGQFPQTYDTGKKLGLCHILTKTRRADTCTDIVILFEFIATITTSWVATISTVIVLIDWELVNPRKSYN